MLYPIEIKANIGGNVGDALAALGDPSPATKRVVWFAEDRSGIVAGKLNLLSRGIILRVRSGEDDDSTAKLRPVDSAHLTPPWADPFTEPPLKYRIEGDWSGDRHVVAASAEASHEQASLSEAVHDSRFDQIFGPQQRRLVRDGAHIAVEVGQLVALGPIDSTKWQDLTMGGVNNVDAERWAVADLDFLERSVRVKPEDDETAAHYGARTEQAQQNLLSAIAELKLELDTNAESKTQRVLAALAASIQRTGTDSREAS
ncbi:hypothetical protein [Mycobacterium sp. JS623]|uniref:hypothetical protein n=1 Tax=Mycobacterium sp. JS623 TaxID=212767 RepID=UPI0002D8B2CA|nr:hypothetical protein [Mycobacterium sp. JS623]